MEEAWCPDFATIWFVRSIRDKIYSHFSLTKERSTINDKSKVLSELKKQNDNKKSPHISLLILTSDPG